jgi:hypothetical protein
MIATTGDVVYIRTINSLRGGKFSFSINGGSPETYDTHAPSTTCDRTPRKRVIAANVKRSSVLTPRNNRNALMGWAGDGETAIDGFGFVVRLPCTAIAHSSDLAAMRKGKLPVLTELVS